MEHRIGAKLTEHAHHGGEIADVDLRQRYAIGQSLLMALYQVVDDDNIVRSGSEASDRSAPDVARASSNRDSHVSSCLLALRLLPDCRIDADRAFPARRTDQIIEQDRSHR